MTSTTEFFPKIIDYPDEDGLPMAESDQTREYLVYSTKVLSVFFQDRVDVYASTGDYLHPALEGCRLVNRIYTPVATTVRPNGTLVLPSAVLGLELHLIGQEMRFYDPLTQQLLLTHEEEASARQTAEDRAVRLAAKLRELNIDPDTI